MELLDPLSEARGLPEASLRQLRGAQLKAVLRLTPVLMVANIVLATVAALCSGRASPLIVFWSLGIWAFALAGICGWWRTRRRSLNCASARAIAALIRQSFLMGLVWSALPPLLMQNGSLEAAALSIALVASLLSCGSFALASVPAAALAYALPMATTICVCMGLSPHLVLRVMAVLEVFFVALLEGLMLTQARQFGARLISELKLLGQHDLLQHLLAEIEADSTAWRWETDSAGRVVNISDRAVAALLEADAAGPTFAELVRAQPSAMEGDVGARLFNALAQKAPFQDVCVPHRAAGATGWWSLSGKPLFDAFGAFTGFRGIGRDITDRRTAEDRIKFLARHDILTGLPNRAAFNERLAGARPGSAPHAVFALDLDRFKAVNDTLGHGAGDALLIQVAQRLQALLPPNTFAARLGGDEFAVLMEGTGAISDLARLAEQVITDLSQPYDLDGQAALIGVSVGVSDQLDAQLGIDGLQRADLALYRAKQDGRGRVRFFEAHMADEARRQHELEAALRTALAAGEFEVHYQPLVDSHTHEVTAFEALLRWNRPGFGLLSPAAFIEKCEQCGLIAQIGAWVLQVATRQATQWLPNVRVAVNLSAVQFASGELQGVVQEALNGSGLDPGRLELEITESVLIADQSSVLRQLEGLKALGVRIALDDFGTGYSSLSYLWRFPFDKLKIDRSFVADLQCAEPVIDIVRTIAALGRTLNLSITAEGVETLEQATTLSELACTELQGYHFGRPMPAGDLAPYLLGNLRTRLNASAQAGTKIGANQKAA